MTGPAYLDEHHAIVGNSGSGKTVTGKGEVEQLLRERRHLAVIDLTDVWYGLRSDVAGTGPGFDIPIFGGRHGDVAIGPGDGDAIARLIIEQRVSAIVSLGHIHDDALQRLFLADFVKRLRAKPRGNFHLIADEAEEICPQTAPDDVAFALTRDMIWIAKRGRVAGFVLTIITQRPADISKAVLSQAQTIIAHQLVAPHDQKAIDDYLKANGDKQIRADVMRSLPGLERGERWIYSPRLGILERGFSPAITTFDSSRTPAPGEEHVEPKTLAELDVSAIAAALKAPATDAPIGADVDATARIRELERKLADCQRVGRALVMGRSHAEVRADTLARQLARIVELASNALQGDAEAVERGPPTLPIKTADFEEAGHAGGERGEGRLPPPPPHHAGGGEAAAKPKRGPASPESSGDDESGAAAPDKEYRALAALAKVAPLGLTEAAWAGRAGYSRKGGAWQRRLTRYRQAGLIEQRDGKFFATDAGLAQVGEQIPDFPEPGPLLVAFWVKRLGAPGRILKRLAELYPQAFTRAGIAGEVGMSEKGGAFQRHMTALKAAGVIQEARKKIRVIPWLMGDE